MTSKRNPWCLPEDYYKWLRVLPGLYLLCLDRVGEWRKRCAPCRPGGLCIATCALLATSAPRTDRPLNGCHEALGYKSIPSNNTSCKALHSQDLGSERYALTSDRAHRQCLGLKPETPNPKKPNPKKWSRSNLPSQIQRAGIPFLGAQPYFPQPAWARGVG